MVAERYRKIAAALPDDRRSSGRGQLGGERRGGGRRIVGLGDRAADHEQVGAAREGLRGRDDAGLVVRRRAGRADAGDHLQQRRRVAARISPRSAAAHTMPPQPASTRDLDPLRHDVRRGRRRRW